MLQLIYASVATDGSASDHLAELCEISSRNNARDEITGILLALDGHYLQVLEGPREAVENTFLRVVTDERHRDVVVLNRHLGAGREFGDFSMKTCDTSAEQRAVIEQIRERLLGASPRAQAEFARHFPLADIAGPPVADAGPIID